MSHEGAGTHLVDGSLGPAERRSQTASLLVDLYLEGSLLSPTDRQTDCAEVVAAAAISALGACDAKKDRPYSTAERRVPDLIPVLGSQPAGDVSHKNGSRLPLLSARPAVTLATLKRTATNFAAW